MKVRTATCAGALAATVAALASVAGECGFVWNLFSMRHRFVGQLVFAVDSLAISRQVANRQSAHRHRFDKPTSVLSSNPAVTASAFVGTNRTDELTTTLLVYSMQVTPSVSP